MWARVSPVRPAGYAPGSNFNSNSLLTGSDSNSNSDSNCFCWPMCGPLWFIGYCPAACVSTLAPFCHLNCRSISLSAFRQGRHVASFTLPTVRRIYVCVCARSLVLSLSIVFSACFSCFFESSPLYLFVRSFALLPSNLIAVNIFFDIRKLVFFSAQRTTCCNMKGGGRVRERERESNAYAAWACQLA